MKLNQINAFMVYQIGRFISLLLINVLMAKSGLTTNELGLFESYVFYASLVSFFWIGGISQFYLSTLQWNQSGSYSKRNVNYFFTFFLISISIAIIIFLSHWLSNSLIKLSNNIDLIFLSIYIVIYPSGFLIEYFLLANHKNKELLHYTIVSVLISIVFVALPSLLGFGLQYCLYGLFLLALLKLFILLNILKPFSGFEPDFTEIRKILKSSSPLVFAALIAGSATYIDGLIVSLKFDQETFAIFRYGAKEFPLFLLISSSFSTSMLVHFSNQSKLAENLALLKAKSRQYIRIFFPLAICLMLVSQSIFEYAFNKNFIQSYPIFDVYLLLIISRFAFPGTILTGNQKNKAILVVSLIELIINVISSLIFVYFFGYVGVAYGTVLAYVSEKIILAAVVKKELGISPKHYTPIKELAIFSVILFICYFFKSAYI